MILFYKTQGSKQPTALTHYSVFVTGWQANKCGFTEPILHSATSALSLSSPQKKVKERRRRGEGCKFRLSGKVRERRESEFYRECLWTCVEVARRAMLVLIKGWYVQYFALPELKHFQKNESYAVFTVSKCNTVCIITCNHATYHHVSSKSLYSPPVMIFFMPSFPSLNK